MSLRSIVALRLLTRTDMRFTLKTATFVLLVAACSSVARAQNTVAPSGDVTIGMSAGTPEYCLGPSGALPSLGSDLGPDDITLRLTLNLRYENHLSETVILPTFNRRIIWLTVGGESGTTILRDSRMGMNVEAVMAMSGPDGSFLMLNVGKERAVFDSLIGYRQSFRQAQRVTIPVLARSSGLDLRGKTVQIVLTLDYGSLPPDVVETLNERWMDYGTVWTGVVESTVTIRIPKEPLTWDFDCRVAG